MLPAAFRALVPQLAPVGLPTMLHRELQSEHPAAAAVGKGDACLTQLLLLRPQLQVAQRLLMDRHCQLQLLQQQEQQQQQHWIEHLILQPLLMLLFP
jgi:hypothetical protein